MVWVWAGQIILVDVCGVLSLSLYLSCIVMDMVFSFFNIPYHIVIPTTDVAFSDVLPQHAPSCLVNTT